MDRDVSFATGPEPVIGWAIPGSLAIVAASPVRPRAVGSGMILRGSIPDFFLHGTPIHSVSFGLSGTSTVEWRHGARLKRFVATPGGFSISPAGSDSAYCAPGAIESLVLGIDAAELDRIAAREFDQARGTVELEPVQSRNHAEINDLGHAYAALLRSSRRGIGLYAETLWLQVAMQLLWNFSSLRRPVGAEAERLSDARVRRVVDHLESSLAEEVSLADLAELAGLSPNHFLNAFKKATGKTPHRFLTERRVARACELLRNPQMPIVSIALAVGFSSQSHFTTVFGRFVGTTPASYRAGVLGSGSRSPRRRDAGGNPRG
jgi:AraC family transcriptional regulator